MSNAMGPGLPRFQSLDRLIQQDASALIVQRGDDGGLRAESSAGMAFRSGLHRTFGAGKSAADAQANLASLNALLDQIESESSKFVREHVEQGLARLSGDEKGSQLTVIDRMKRGTYVSSDLVAQLKNLAVAGAKAELEHQNTTAVHDFLTRERGDALDWELGFGRMADQSGVEALLGRLAAEGSEQWPIAEYPRAWAALQDYVRGKMETGVKAQDDPVLGGLHKQLEKLVDEANAKNVRLTPELLDRAATGYLSQPKVFSTFVQLANLSLASDVVSDPKATADVIRQWGAAVDPEELGGLLSSDWTWLANQVEDRDMLQMPETGPFRHLTQLFKDNLVYSEDRDVHLLRGKIADHLQDQLKVDVSKLEGASLSEMRRFIKEELVHPKELTVRDLARMMTPVIKPVMVERRERMDKIDAEAAEFRKKVDATLDRRLGAFPELQEIAVAVDRRDIPAFRDSMPEVDSAQKFIEALVTNTILHAEHQADMAEKLQGRSPQDLSTDEVLNLAKETQSLVALRRSMWETQFEMALPALDKFADLEARLAELATKGGIGAASLETWQQIESAASEIAGGVDNLRHLANMMRERHGEAHPELARMADALDAAAARIDKGVAPYRDLTARMASARNERMLVHLPSLHALGHKTAGGEDEGGRTRVTSSPTGLVTGLATVARSGGNVTGRSEQALTSWIKEQAPFLDRFAEFALKAERPEARAGLAGEQKEMAKGVERFAREVETLRRNLDPEATRVLGDMLDALDGSVEEMRGALKDSRFVDTGSMSPFVETGRGTLVRDPEVFMDGLRAARSLDRGNKAMAQDFNTAFGLIDEFSRFDRGFIQQRADHPVPSPSDRLAIGRLDRAAQSIESRLGALDRAIQRLEPLRRTLEAGLMPISDDRERSRDAIEGMRLDSIAKLRELETALTEQKARIEVHMDDYSHYRRDADVFAPAFALIADMRPVLARGTTPDGGFERAMAYDTERFLAGLGPAAGELRDLVAPALGALDQVDALEAQARELFSAEDAPKHPELLRLGHDREELGRGREALKALVDGLGELPPDRQSADALTEVRGFLQDALNALDARLATLDRDVNREIGRL